MSSDSEESRTSAHDNDGGHTYPSGRVAVDTPDREQAFKESPVLTRPSPEEDVVDSPLGAESLPSESNNLTFARHKRSQAGQEEDESGSELAIRSAVRTAASPESVSTPDDTPSIQGSILSSPGSSAPASHSSFRGNRPAALQPFERRFSARPSPSPLGSPRVYSSPAFLSPRSRQSSISSNAIFQIQQDGTDTPQTPWDVVRWTKLKKITGQVFSEVGKRNFGRPTCLSVAASLVIGTSKGFVLVFDYQQVLKSIIGPGTKAVECGPITSLAMSADHSTVAGGHATGHIFTWELARPAKPFLHIPPLDRASLDDRRSDGHISGVAILHLGFLGTRHTALVSADDAGMAFSHLATRGLGALARSVKITRILGRYPLSDKSMEKPRKPSSVLAFAPLPLGNVEQPTDDMGLTALLTPYLLIIVSTTPIAQTQHKAPRPKDVAPHSTLSGCLAWFPAVKLKNPTGDPNKAVSRTKLVYCWSNVLTILDVESIVAPPSEKEKPTELRFKPRSRWKGEEAIVAVQWLSRSVLGVLTISQRLIILEDSSLRVTDSFDLLQKHMYHSDLFSRQLRGVIEDLDEGDTSLHGVIADAFYMSFRAYKGRMFLLGVNDVSIGTLSNWADRLLALMEDGDYISALNLACSYYVGDTDKLTVGLPEDDESRHVLVQEKLLDMMSASLKYTFARSDNTRGDKQVKDLASACFIACLSMRELDFLFEDVYDAFEEGSAERLFFEVLEPYITDEEISALPPNVLKDLITSYASSGRTAELEDIVCRLDTDTMDINQITTLCQQYNLYDALIYVWTRAIGDFITPLTKLLSLIKLLDWDTDEDQSQNIYMTSAMKIFPYMAYTFTGRVYPGGSFMDDEQAYSAKKDMYRFMFSGSNLKWPPGSGDVVETRIDKSPEPDFPYLRLVLAFDTSSFMSMLNEAFEDSFLNDEQDGSNGSRTNGTASRGSSLTPTRQYIINILMGIMTTESFDIQDIIYFYMFMARNLPKYPQHIMLTGTALHRVLVGLCDYPTDDIQDDRQLSAEYLLSIYHPPNLQGLVPLFEKAGFYRVLKSVYKNSQQYAKLLETYLDDTENRSEVFGCVTDCLRPGRGLNKKQVNEVKSVICSRARELAVIDASRTAVSLQQYAPDLLQPVLDALDQDSEAQYGFLKALIEPESVQGPALSAPTPTLPEGFMEQYVTLMCKYSSSHVAGFVSSLKTGNLELDPILPALEQSGVIEAAIVLMARDGLTRAAMDRLVKHLGTLETALTGLVSAAGESPDAANTEEAIHDLLTDIQKYVKVGIWLCQGQTKTMGRNAETLIDRRKSAYGKIQEQDLALDELLWLDLVDVVVMLAKDASAAIARLDTSLADAHAGPIDTAKITTGLRTSVQQTFSALLASTTMPPSPSTTASKSSATSRPPLQTRKSQAQTNPSFLRVLRTFLTRASHSSPSLSDLRAVLQEIFAAYTFEETILSLANRFLDKEGFKNVEEISQLRQRGWRPRGQVCEGCRKRAWGPGAGAGTSIWESWERKENARLRRRAVETADEGGKGKGRSVTEHDAEEEESEVGKGPLVVFACRHIWHRTCLEKALEGEGSGEGAKRLEGMRLKCPLCV